MISIQETETENVYERHDILFYAKKYNLNNQANPTTFRTIQKTHPNGNIFSHGNLDIRMPPYSVIQIGIGKKL